MEFKINASGIPTSTVSITDFKIVAKKLAKVIVAFTSKPTREEVVEALTAKMQYLAAPVENSFRIIKDNVAVGFVRASTEVRAIEDKEQLRANYKVMASNILMDNADKTLWEVKEGASGKFLARHGHEDLSELVGAAINHRQDVPKIRQLAQASVAPREFVAFASASGDMDYGFCIKAHTKEGVVCVVSATTGQAVNIPADVVASVIPVGGVKIPLSAHQRITAAGIDRNAVGQEKDYYTRLYSYAPDYLAEVIRQVEGTAAM